MKKVKIALLAIVLLINISFPALANDDNFGFDTQSQNANSVFANPVCLLVGLNSNELSYQELSGLSGVELFSVPYKTDVKALIAQMKPTQVIIKHPSGFVGLYSTDGQLIRGVQTTGNPTVAIGAGVTPPSIITPTEANPPYENLFYPGTDTGSVPRGGIGYKPAPKGRNLKRGLLKLAAITSFAPFGYPGYFKSYGKQSQLLPVLLGPQVPLAIGAAASYADAKLDSQEYEQARSQPRDYMFQPVIEGY